MKKLALAVALLAIVFAAPAFAAERQLTFGWSQATEDLPNLDKWVLYMTGNGITPQVVEIPYVDGQTQPFESVQNFTIPGNSGDTVTRSFYIVAVGKNGVPAGPSNTITETFQIPYPNVGAATNFEVKVSVWVE